MMNIKDGLIPTRTVEEEAFLKVVTSRLSN